jgi:hypothetical protein
MTDAIIPHNLIDARDRFRLFGPVDGLEFDWPPGEWEAVHRPALRVAAILVTASCNARCGRSTRLACWNRR